MVAKVVTGGWKRRGGGVPSKPKEYAGWYFRVDVRVRLLGRESSACRWGGGWHEACQGLVKGYLKGLSRAYQGLVKGVSRAVPRACQGLVKGLSRGCQGVVKGYVKGLSRACQGLVRGLSRALSRACQGLVKVLVCFPLAAPIGLSPLYILTLCGSERVWRGLKAEYGTGGGGGSGGTRRVGRRRGGSMVGFDRLNVPTIDTFSH